MYQWIKHFLTNRTIQTKVHNGISSKEILEEGLPQGSSLSCTLFLIFINDIPDELQSEKAMYADDLALWHSHNKVETSVKKLNEDLERLEAYCDMWKLKVNHTKTTYTIFTKSSKVAKQEVNLSMGGKKIQKEENPIYLGVQLDRQLTLKRHVQNLKEKATKRLRLVKRLASSSWGADKNTLRQLYIGYVRSSMEYNLALQTISSKTTKGSLDRVQNEAVRFISGGMRSTPTAACEVHANVEPLDLRREAAAVEMVERYRRTHPEHPTKKLVEDWTPNNRIQQKSILKVEAGLQEKHHLPQNREPLETSKEHIPPNADIKKPNIKLNLNTEVSKKETDPNELMVKGQETIGSYPDEWIHVYTDGSAFKGTTNAGYGARIEYADKSCNEIHSPCGVFCSNFEAEALAIEAAIHQIRQELNVRPEKVNNIVVFSDSKSVLQSVDQDRQDNATIRSLVYSMSSLTKHFSIELHLQWIPSHCGIPGNERADTLAARGAKSEQIERPVSQRTAKQMIRSNSKIEWMTRWALGNTGRAIFTHMASPNINDPVNSLRRQEQVIIFRLRTRHVQLNAHLNRIQPEIAPLCTLCNHPYETVKHFLLDCQPLKDLREQHLPPTPDLGNTLYTHKRQLQQTCTYYIMAFCRRAQAQMTAGSRK